MNFMDHSGTNMLKLAALSALYLSSLGTYSIVAVPRVMGVPLIMSNQVLIV